MDENIMTYTVWKHTLNIAGGIQEIEVPEDTEFLTAREQGNTIGVWYRCNPNLPMIKRELMVVPTGGDAPSPDNWMFVGMASLEGGRYIFHVFLKLYD
jgi:hypothetical protein